jgi:hypothetical protein
VAGCGLGIALAVAVVLAPFASQHPDGLEFVAGKLGLPAADAPSPLPVLMPDYVVPGLDASVGMATAAAGVVGTLVVFAVAALLALPVARLRPGRGRRAAEGEPVHAA